MNDRMKESLSALVDGEADELEIRRVLNQAEQDDTLREQWGRYQLIGSVMREEPASTTDLSKGIMQALDGLPMDDVPAMAAASANESASESARVATPPAVENKSSRFGWLTSGAVAASVTLAVLLGARVTNDAATPVSATGLASTSTSVGASAVNPVSSTPVSSLVAGSGSQLVSATTDVLPFSPLPDASVPEPTLTEDELRQAQNKLRAYVMQHSEHAALNTGRGLMPYARISNFEADDQQ